MTVALESHIDLACQTRTVPVCAETWDGQSKEPSELMPPTQAHVWG